MSVAPVVLPSVVARGGIHFRLGSDSKSGAFAVDDLGLAHFVLAPLHAVSYKSIEFYPQFWRSMARLVYMLFFWNV
jgi:hypothetical protein